MEYLEMVVKGIFVVVALLMTFFILLQEGKGGGLTGLGGTKAAGVEGVTNPIRRFTGYLAGIFFILAIVLGLMAREPGTGISVTQPGKERLSSGEEKTEKDDSGMGASPTLDTEDVELAPKSKLEKPDEAAPAGEKTAEKTAAEKSEAAEKTGEAKSEAVEKTGEAKTPELAPEAKTEKTAAPAEAKTAAKSEAPAEKSPPAE